MPLFLSKNRGKFRWHLKNVIFPFFGKVLNLLGTKIFVWKKCGPSQRYPEKTFNLGWDGLDLPVFWVYRLRGWLFCKTDFFVSTKCPDFTMSEKKSFFGCHLNFPRFLESFKKNRRPFASDMASWLGKKNCATFFRRQNICSHESFSLEPINHSTATALRLQRYLRKRRLKGAISP